MMTKITIIVAAQTHSGHDLEHWCKIARSLKWCDMILACDCYSLKKQCSITILGTAQG